MEHFVVVGGGVAAHQSVKSILQLRPDSRVSLVSDDWQLPYDRPHLSKGFLTSQSSEPALLAGHAIYRESGVELIRGTSVESIERGAAQVRLSNGQRLDYDKLVIATGSRVRQLPATLGRAMVHYLRTSDDALTLRKRLVARSDVVIIGGGFIGLEIAAAARQQLCRVTVIESQPLLLARTGCAALSHWAQRIHLAHGVGVQLGIDVLSIEHGVNGKQVVRTSAGTVLADVVVAGIGVQPNVELATECGLMVDDGIIVDSRCRTLESNIFAAGEVTRYPVTRLGTHTRSESWTAAGEQGSVAGRSAAGDDTATYDEMPWLWSDQYSSSLQCLGLPGLTRKYSFIGDLQGDQWLALGWNVADQLVCAIGANMNREISTIRRSMRRDEPLAEHYASTVASAKTMTMN